jgi:hypothetical protein
LGSGGKGPRGDINTGFRIGRYHGVVQPCEVTGSSRGRVGSQIWEGSPWRSAFAARSGDPIVAAQRQRFPCLRGNLDAARCHAGLRRCGFTRLAAYHLSQCRSVLGSVCRLRGRGLGCDRGERGPLTPLLLEVRLHSPPELADDAGRYREWRP